MALHNFFYRELQFDMLQHTKKQMDKRSHELVGRRKTSIVLLEEKEVNDKVAQFKGANSGLDISGI